MSADGPIINDDLLEGYISYEIALGLLFSALVTDALFGGVRKLATNGVPTLQLMFIFTIGQFVFFLLLWGVVGSDLVSMNYGYEVVFALLAGINVQVAEYLFTIASKYLKSAVATACVSIEFVFSSFILYAMLPQGISITYLGVGLLLITLGILSNLMPLLLNGYRNAQAKKAALTDRPVITVAHNVKKSDYVEDDEGNQFESVAFRRRSLSSTSFRSNVSSKGSELGLTTPRETEGTGEKVGEDKGEDEGEDTRLLEKDKKDKGKEKRLRFTDGAGEQEKEVGEEGGEGRGGGGGEEEEVSDDALAQQDAALEADAHNLQPSHNVFWITLALGAGLLMSSWAILTSLATMGDGGITHTADLLFIFSCGQLIALPILILLFGYWDVVNMRQPVEGPFRLADFFAEMGKMPGYRYLIIIALALVKDAYEAGYFYVLGSGEIPRAVIYATLSTIAPIATLASLFIFNEYSDVPLCSDFYLFTLISFMFFGFGVFVVLTYAFDDSVSDDYEFQR